MDKMTLASKSLIKDTRGANLVEYILLVGLVAIVAMAGFSKFGKAVTDKVEEQSNTVGQIPGGGG